VPRYGALRRCGLTLINCVEYCLRVRQCQGCVSLFRWRHAAEGSSLFSFIYYRGLQQRNMPRYSAVRRSRRPRIRAGVRANPVHNHINHNLFPIGARITQRAAHSHFVTLRVAPNTSCRCWSLFSLLFIVCISHIIQHTFLQGLQQRNMPRYGALRRSGLTLINCVEYCLRVRQCQGCVSLFRWRHAAEGSSLFSLFSSGAPTTQHAALWRFATWLVGQNTTSLKAEVPFCCVSLILYDSLFYRGSNNATCRALALCDVAGGPEYKFIKG